MKARIYAWGFEVNRGMESDTTRKIAKAYGYNNSRAQYKEFEIVVGEDNNSEVTSVEDLKSQHYGTGWVWSRI